MKADNHREILCVDLADATTEAWKYIATISGCYLLRRTKCEAEIIG